jgi:hypothetical protein
MVRSSKYNAISRLWREIQNKKNLKTNKKDKYREQTGKQIDTPKIYHVLQLRANINVN